MTEPLWAWIVVIGGLLIVLAVDLWIVDRGEAREFSMRQAGGWVSFYVTLAVIFGVVLWLTLGAEKSGEFFAGYITEYSLSVDNLFVFYIIMSRFAVPKVHQHKVLLIGILLALVMRGIFIGLGAAALERFGWLFYVFGAFLVYTAINIVRGHLKGEEEEVKENLLLRWVRRSLPTTQDYVGSKITVKIDGRRMVTPMLIVMIAIGSTDLLFALDSIPAIFGLTQNVYLVFTATAFSLLGLRQLYFLIDGLLDRLIYLSYGLAAILAFIGVKLFLHALHENNVPFINDGEPVNVVEIPTGLSLIVIIGVLTVTKLSKIKGKMKKSRERREKRGNKERKRKSKRRKEK